MVTGILVVISGLMLINNREFGGRILLENLAYDIALTVREAQVYGISVRQFEGDSGATFNLGYGVYFDANDTKRYTLFADVEQDGLWESGESVGSPYVIERGYAIEKLCVPAGDNAEDCNSDVERVDIVFRRPEPDACIAANGNSPVEMDDDDLICADSEESARIVLISPRGDLASVVVHTSGQIHVE